MPILKSDEVDLFYEVTGSGEPVLLIQGVGVIGRGFGFDIRSFEH